MEKLGEDECHCPRDEASDSVNLQHCGVGCYGINTSEARYWCTSITGG